MSAMLPPLFLKFVNAAWPGVSTKSKPGIVRLIFINFERGLHLSFITETGTSLAPMCWVIAPASLDAIVDERTQSRIDVLP